jgi:hypothetical protein
MGVASVCWTTAASSRVWTVPDDAPTIQAAIDLASAGDVVEIRAGTYLERGIELKGDVPVRAITDGTVTVDADRKDRVFWAEAQPGTVSLRGLIIENGLTGGQGGGIEVVNASIHIVNCTIQQCESTSFVGGISVADGEIVIDGSTIQDNLSPSSVGGLYVEGGLLRMSGCRVLRNNAGWGICGGIRCEGVDVEIRDTLIAENAALSVGGGEALHVAGGTCRIVGCTIAANERWSAANAALEFYSVEAGSLERCIVAFNEGEALDCYFSDIEVRCTNIFGNGGDDFCTIDAGGNFQRGETARYERF